MFSTLGESDETSDAETTQRKCVVVSVSARVLARKQRSKVTHDRTGGVFSKTKRPRPPRLKEKHGVRRGGKKREGGEVLVS